MCQTSNTLSWENSAQFSNVRVVQLKGKKKQTFAQELMM